jgi:hypothetical protein
MNAKILIPGIALMNFFLFVNGYGQTQVKRLKLFVIGAEETAVYGESEIFLDNVGAKVSLVTSDLSNKFYYYDRGVKKGPFISVDSTCFKPASGDQKLISSIFNSKGAKSGRGLSSKDSEGRAVICSGSKIYGPFESIENIWADNNGHFLMAIIAEKNENFLLTTAGSFVPLEGLPYSTSISPSGNKSVMTVIADRNHIKGSLNRDYSKMSAEEILKISEPIDGPKNNEIDPVGWVYTNDGKKYGPFSKEAVFSGNPFFSDVSGDNWIFLNGTELFVNGILLSKIPLDHVSTGDLWLSSDGKRYAVIAYEKILFSDGAIFPFPLRIRMVKESNNTRIYWIGLENRTEVYLYSRIL